MIVSIMQPYFFPYIGYFQLIAQSDVFVFHDDVQYIRGGWVNRNRFLRDGQVVWLTCPVQHSPHDWPINRRVYCVANGELSRLGRQLESAYRAAPHAANIMPLIRELLGYADANVAAFNINLVSRIARCINAKTQFVLSSCIDKDNSLTGEARVINICRRLGAKRYVNPIGGLGLYRRSSFDSAGIELAFLESAVAPFAGQGRYPLSIIHDLMHRTTDALSDRMRDYRLVWQT
jgi:hypothetical protein